MKITRFGLSRYKIGDANQTTGVGSISLIYLNGTAIVLGSNATSYNRVETNLEGEFVGLSLNLQFDTV